MTHTFPNIRVLVRTMVAALLLMLLTGTLSHAQPKISVASTSLDFGPVYNGEDVQRTTMVYNCGSETLSIVQVNSPCSCTRPSIASHAIAPGDSSSLVVEFNGKMFSGPLRKDILIVSNDPVNRNQFIQIKADVKPVFRLGPATIVLFTHDEPESLGVQMTNMYRDPITITGIGDSSGYLGTTISPTGPVPPGRSVVLSVVTRTKVKETYIGRIRITLAGAPVSELQVPYILRPGRQE